MCKYHIVFTPKYRRKMIYNQYRDSLKEIIQLLCKYKGVEIIEGHMIGVYVFFLSSFPERIGNKVVVICEENRYNNKKTCYF